MLHHISLAAKDPLHVAQVLAEVWHGRCFEFSPHPGSYFVCPFDDHGSAIEIYPLGTEIVPGLNNESLSFAQSPRSVEFTAVHAAVSVPTSLEKIQQIGAREGWRTVVCDRGPFHVIEFWVENWLMLELLPPAFASEYLNFARSQVVEQVFVEVAPVASQVDVSQAIGV